MAGVMPPLRGAVIVSPPANQITCRYEAGLADDERQQIDIYQGDDGQMRLGQPRGRMSG